MSDQNPQPETERSDEKARIHEAMEQCDGSMVRAARVLKTTAGALKNKIHSSEELKLRWITPRQTPEPPSEAVDIHRKVKAPLLPAQSEEGSYATELELAKALDKEDRLVRAGIESIGVTGDELDMAVALQRFHRRNFRSMLDLLGGGLAKQFIELMAEVRKITELLNNTDQHNVMSEAAVEYEAILRKDRTTIIALMNAMYDRTLQATLTAAKIRQLENGRSPDAPRHGKPGFGQMKKVEEAE